MIASQSSLEMISPFTQFCNFSSPNYQSKVISSNKKSNQYNLKSLSTRIVVNHNGDDDDIEDQDMQIIEYDGPSTNQSSKLNNINKNYPKSTNPPQKAQLLSKPSKSLWKPRSTIDSCHKLPLFKRPFTWQNNLDNGR